jgi:peptidyl-prolyl cis-trans isomerase SurA
VQLPPEQELQRQVLERMILDRAQLQMARDGGVRIDDAAVDRRDRADRHREQRTVGQLRQRVEADGLSFQSFRRDVGNEMPLARLRERQVDARVQVSEAEIDAHLAEQNSGPVEYNIAQRWCAWPRTRAPSRSIARAGRPSSSPRPRGPAADFERLAARAAAGTDAVTGGIIGPRSADRLPKLFVDAVAPLRMGEVAPVLRSPAGFHVLRLLERRAGRRRTLAGAPVRRRARVTSWCAPTR